MSLEMNNRLRFAMRCEGDKFPLAGHDTTPEWQVGPQQCVYYDGRDHWNRWINGARGLVQSVDHWGET